jgi:hypothetical protein
MINFDENQCDRLQYSILPPAGPISSAQKGPVLIFVRLASFHMLLMIYVHLRSIIGTVKIAIIKIDINLIHMGPSSLGRTPRSTLIITVIVEIRILIWVLFPAIFLSMKPLAKTANLPILLLLLRLDGAATAMNLQTASPCLPRIITL